MFVWQQSETINVDVSVDKIWKIWAHSEAWPEWDDELKWVTLDGPFMKGTKGKMKPVSGPTVAFELIKVEPNKIFINRAKLPLTTLDFVHFYTPIQHNSTTAQITHSIEFRGVLAPLFGFLIGRKIKKHLRSAMLNLLDKAQNLEIQSKQKTLT